MYLEKVVLQSLDGGVSIEGIVEEERVVEKKVCEDNKECMKREFTSEGIYDVGLKG